MSVVDLVSSDRNMTVRIQPSANEQREAYEVLKALEQPEVQRFIQRLHDDALYAGLGTTEVGEMRKVAPASMEETLIANGERIKCLTLLDYWKQREAWAKNVLEQAFMVQNDSQDEGQADPD